MRHCLGGERGRDTGTWLEHVKNIKKVYTGKEGRLKNVSGIRRFYLLLLK